MSMMSKVLCETSSHCAQHKAKGAEHARCTLAAGDNVSADIYRMANLLQISSAFERAMETVNRSKMSKALFPVMKEFLTRETLMKRELLNAIHACAEGYSFPTNLDLDPPIGGLAPTSQSQIMEEALEQNLSTAQFAEILDQLHARQQS